VDYSGQTASNPAILRYSKQESYYRKDYKRQPTALAVDNQGRLLVADNGPRLLKC